MPKSSFLARYATHILIISAIVTPLACWGALKAIKGNRNDVSDWLPKSYPETIELGWFRQHFVADQFIIVSWDGCTLGDDPSGARDDERIAKLSKALLEVQLPKDVSGSERACFKSVTSARIVMRELMASPTELSQKQAIARLKGSLIGPDGKQTCVMATLTEAAAANLRQVVGRPFKGLGLRKWPTSPLFQAIHFAGLTENDVRLGGPPIDNVAIDAEGQKTLLRLAGLSAALSIALAYWSLRSVRMTAIVFTCGVMSAALSLAAVPLLGSRMDAILMSMPALIYVIAVSGAVHIINYYRQAAADAHSVEHAAEHVIAHAWRPAILTSVTTAIGLASLLTSDIVPIAKFGGFSAIGTMTMLFVLFAVLPAAMKKWPWIPPELRAKGSHGAMTQAEDGPSFGAKGWTLFGTFVRHHHAAVLTSCMVVIALLCVGLPKVKTSIDLLKLFSKDARLLKDYAWFEDHLGRIVPMELVVTFPASVQRESAPANMAPGQLADRLTFLERLEMVARIEASIDRRLGARGQDLIGATMSAATFAPDIGGQGSGGTTNSYRYVANENLSAHRDEFKRAGYLRIEGKDSRGHAGDELWRISVRVAAFHGIDHGELVNRVRQAIEPVVAAHETSVDAMKALAQRRQGVPKGARVIVWQMDKDSPTTDNIAAALASKSVLTAATSLHPTAATDEQLAKFKKYDGVILGPGFPHAEIERLRLASIPILATYEGGLARAKQDGSAVDGVDHVDVTYTGVIPVVYKAQHALLTSLVQSTWWSFATIMPLMMWVCRGLAAGVVVMIPNTLPVLVVFGGMGWLGIPVDIGSMMAASIALGVAVDDTIHFLAWYRDDLKSLGNRHEAVLASYRRSANATLQAGLINGLGLSVFAATSITPTQRFGWLMLTILIAGITAELIMLPALLFGPAGKVFSTKGQPTKDGRKGAASKPHFVLSPLDRRRALREYVPVEA
jgi:predicted RND superfamily exporter protein